jgi:hypothetical protein
MPLTVTDVDGLRTYICGVMERASHHAGNVDEVALALVGAILWRKDDDADIKVMAKNGEAKNVLWVRIGEQRYAFSYNHRTGKIEMRAGNMRGKPLHRFSNATQLSKVKAIFERL